VAEAEKNFPAVDWSLMKEEGLEGPDREIGRFVADDEVSSSSSSLLLSSLELSDTKVYEP